MKKPFIIGKMGYTVATTSWCEMMFTCYFCIPQYYHIIYIVREYVFVRGWLIPIIF